VTLPSPRENKRITTSFFLHRLPPGFSFPREKWSVRMEEGWSVGLDGMDGWADRVIAVFTVTPPSTPALFGSESKISRHAIRVEEPDGEWG